MLDAAIKYEYDLKNKFYDIWFNKKYMYWNSSSVYDEYHAQRDTYATHEFVSLNKHNDIIGYISYNINNISNTVTSLSIINFNNSDPITFGLDIKQVIDDIFIKFNYRKLIFTVIIGNPAEESYDKLILKFGGRIIGIFKGDVKLMDGNYYDVKYYELFKDDYINHKNKKVTYCDKLEKNIIRSAISSNGKKVCSGDTSTINFVKTCMTCEHYQDNIKFNNKEILQNEKKTKQIQ